jgi:hypothetical protein
LEIWNFSPFFYILFYYMLDIVLSKKDHIPTRNMLYDGSVPVFSFKEVFFGGTWIWTQVQILGRHSTTFELCPWHFVLYLIILIILLYFWVSTH